MNKEPVCIEREKKYAHFNKNSFESICYFHAIARDPGNA